MPRHGGLIDLVLNTGAAVIIGTTCSASSSLRTGNLQPDPCRDVNYDPNVGTLFRSDGSLVGIGIRGQGVLLTGDHTDFANGDVDLIYEIRNGKKVGLRGARFTGKDGTNITKVIGSDCQRDRPICPSAGN